MADNDNQARDEAARRYAQAVNNRRNAIVHLTLMDWNKLNDQILTLTTTVGDLVKDNTLLKKRLKDNKDTLGDMQEKFGQQAESTVVLQERMQSAEDKINKINNQPWARPHKKPKYS